MGIRDNLRRVLDRIEQARRRSPFAQSVRVVAVTKGVDLSRIQQAVAEGVQEFGENRVQEAASKVSDFPSLRWHLIGHLQTNKAKQALGLFELIQSVDRLPLAEAIQREAQRSDRTASILVQVNTQEDPSKFGILPQELLSILEKVAALDRLRVLGLMTIAPFVSDPEQCRPFFRKLRLLKESAEKETFPNCEFSILSMGMSQDFEAAIEEGSTMVRIGTAIFGERHE